MSWHRFTFRRRTPPPCGRAWPYGAAHGATLRCERPAGHELRGDRSCAATVTDVDQLPAEVRSWVLTYQRLTGGPADTVVWMTAPRIVEPARRPDLDVVEVDTGHLVLPPDPGS